jgi:hypothetical protein
MPTPKKKQKPVSDPFEGLQSISKLPPDHYARKYLIRRKIPSSFWSGLYFCPEFKKFVNTLIPDKYSSPIYYEDARIIIPLMTKSGMAIGFQGRAVGLESEGDGSFLRYITIILEEDMARLYGLDRINLNKRYYVTEGPFDSMFLDNALAICGSDLISALHKIDANKELAVAVYDNEPRNVEIVKKMRKTIKDGWKICIWPSSFGFKDINESILGGLNSAEAMHIIDQHTFVGLEAELEMVRWGK